MKKILIAEDDASINNLLRELLERNGFAPVQAFSGTEALMLLDGEAFDLVLLDLMLPGKSGAEALSEIRAKGSTPVIVLTAVTDKDKVVSLLGAGANDYVTKPFDNAELLARIEVQLRNTAGANGGGGKKALLLRALTLDLERFDAFASGKGAGLSKREFEILRLLMENPNKVFTKNNIYESVWNDEFLGDDNTVNVHISKIRSKLAKITPGEDFIQTVWGIGFKMS